MSGRTSDGLVEAIERDHDLDADWERWMVGVQWHPRTRRNDDPRSKHSSTVSRSSRGCAARRPSITASAGRARIRCVEPDPAWPERFEQEAARARVALGAQVVRIEHIGSTSVRGFRPSRIIDISVGLASMEPRGCVRAARCTVWGTERSWIPPTPDHEFASLDLDGERRFHVHLCLAGSRFERQAPRLPGLARTHPDDAAAYGELKRELAATHPNDVHTYTEAKTGFIRSIEAQALAAASESGLRGSERGLVSSARYLDNPAIAGAAVRTDHGSRGTGGHGSTVERARWRMISGADRISSPRHREQRRQRADDPAEG